MKIGIITFYRVPNYGAMLQAYALQVFLQARGHEVVFIKTSFSCARRYSSFRILSSRSLEGVRLKLQHNRDIAICDDFCQHFVESGEFGKKDSDDLSVPCDAYVVGSDQMWNPAWCRPHLQDVFLGFVPDSGKRISYAASFGVTVWPADSSGEVGELLKRFDSISVREKSGIDLVHRLAGRKAEWLPDPTLLHSRAFYDTLVPGVATKNEKFVFKYILPWKTSNIEPCLNAIQGALSVDCVKSHVVGMQEHVIPQLRIAKKMGVSEWVRAFKDAAFVITNSFHGTVFAIIYRKPFICMALAPNGVNSGMNERVVSLLERLGLEERLLVDFSEERVRAICQSEILWDEVEDRLLQWQAVACCFWDAVGV